MPLDEAEFQDHLADFEAVTGKTTDQFVCPLTLRMRPKQELQAGHIINSAFKNARRSTVIQWGPIDQYYGGKVEGALISHLNNLLMPHEEKTANCTFFLITHDKKDHPAFWEHSKTGKRISKVPKIAKEWFINVHTKKVEWFYIKGMSENDPRLDHSPILIWREKFEKTMASAALLKSAILTLFRVMGYRCLHNPMIEKVRALLANAYYANAGAKNMGEYFGDFTNAFGIIEEIVNGDPNNAGKPHRFNTLDDGEIITVQDERGAVFALTLMYLINRMTVSITIPLSSQQGDGCWEKYLKYINNPTEISHTCARRRWVGDRWVVVGVVDANYTSVESLVKDRIADGTWKFEYYKKPRVPPSMDDSTPPLNEANP